MRNRVLIALILIVAFPSVALAKVESSAVWNPGDDVIQGIQNECADDKDVTKCFAEKMQKAGASKQAVKFAKSLSTFGILWNLRETGRVDIAYVVYPFRANENYGVLLVNGKPSTIDVDDLTLLNQDNIKSDPLYPKIEKKYHGFGLWPGDRFNMDSPAVEIPKGGGQWFAVEYRMTSGCHACEDVATARFGFDFNEKGKFQGAKFIRLIGR